MVNTLFLYFLYSVRISPYLRNMKTIIRKISKRKMTKIVVLLGHMPKITNQESEWHVTREN